MSWYLWWTWTKWGNESKQLATLLENRSTSIFSGPVLACSNENTSTVWSCLSNWTWSFRAWSCPPQFKLPRCSQSSCRTTSLEALKDGQILIVVLHMPVNWSFNRSWLRAFLVSCGWWVKSRSRVEIHENHMKIEMLFMLPKNHSIYHHLYIHSDFRDWCSRCSIIRRPPQILGFQGFQKILPMSRLPKRGNPWEHPNLDNKCLIGPPAAVRACHCWRHRGS